MLVNMRDGMRFGVGIDALTESVRATALEFNAEVDGEGGQRVGAEVKMIETQESLMESLSLSVAASINYGLASLDARMELAKSSAVNLHSLYVLFKATVTNPARHMDRPKLLEPAETLYRTDPEAFRLTYGDHYIDEIYSGGAFFGLFTFETRDSSSQSSLSAELRASVGGFLAGGEITASFRQTVEEFKSQSNMSINVLMDGGGNLENPSTLEELQELYENFNTSVKDHPIDYRASLKEFRYLPMPPGPSWAEHLVRAQTIKTCGTYVIETLGELSEIDFVLRYPEQFESHDASALRAYRGELEGQLPKWGRRATACSGDVDKCAITMDEQPPARPSLPKRITTTDPLGEKHAWLLAHDDRGKWAYNPKGLGDRTLDKDWQPGPDGGRYIYFKDYYENVAPGRSHFGVDAGGLFYKPGVGAFGVGGTFLEIYLWTGGCFGPHGYPIEDETFVEDKPGWRRQRFEREGDWRPPSATGYGVDSRFVSDSLWYYSDGKRGYPFPKDVIDHATNLSQWH